eukprot:gene21101-biopygen17636
MGDLSGNLRDCIPLPTRGQPKRNQVCACVCVLLVGCSEPGTAALPLFGVGQCMPRHRRPFRAGEPRATIVVGDLVECRLTGRCGREPAVATSSRKTYILQSCTNYCGLLCRSSMRCRSFMLWRSSMRNCWHLGHPSRRRTRAGACTHRHECARAQYSSVVGEFGAGVIVEEHRPVVTPRFVNAPHRQSSVHGVSSECFGTTYRLLSARHEPGIEWQTMPRKMATDAQTPQVRVSAQCIHI